MKDTRDLAILDHLRAARAASVAELAEAAKTSIATMRRDLQRLDEAGLLRRTHGGAVVLDADAPFADVEPVNRDAKERIAAHVVAGVEDGQSLILDIGTTTLQVARMLHHRRVTIITPSLAVYEALRDDREVHLILLPGDYDPVYRSVSGHLTTECLRSVHADHALLGVSGIADNGDLRDTTIAQVPIKRAMMDACDRATVLADSSKFPGQGIARIAPVSSLTGVITDEVPPATTAASLAAQGVEVTVA